MNFTFDHIALKKFTYAHGEIGNPYNLVLLFSVNRELFLYYFLRIYDSIKFRLRWVIDAF